MYCSNEINNLYVEYLKLMQLIKKSSNCAKTSLYNDFKIFFDNNKDKMFNNDFASNIFNSLDITIPITTKFTNNTNSNINNLNNLQLISKLPFSFKNQHGQVSRLQELFEDNKLHINFGENTCYMGKTEADTVSSNNGNDNKVLKDSSRFTDLEFSLIDEQNYDNYYTKNSNNNLRDKVGYNLICKINRSR